MTGPTPTASATCPAHNLANLTTPGFKAERMLFVEHLKRTDHQEKIRFVQDIATVRDLAILLGDWGPCPDCPADLNGDGVVDAADLATLLGAWT